MIRFLTKMEKSFDIFYSEISPFLVVGLSLLYFVARNIFFAPHILIFGWLLIGCMLIIHMIRKLIQKGWIPWIRDLIKNALSKTWITLLFGIEKIRNNWTGRVLGLFAMTNLLFFLPWIYYNLDLFAWIRSSYTLLFKCFKSLFDPIALLDAFDTWKSTIPVLGIVLTEGTVYVDLMLQACKNGDLNVLIIIPVMTMIILSFAIIAYAISNIDHTFVISMFKKFPDFIMILPLLIFLLIGVKHYFKI